jgi:Uma2 family endonuclease
VTCPKTGRQGLASPALEERNLATSLARSLARHPQCRCYDVLVAHLFDQDQREVLHDVSWETFERVLDDKGDDGAPRVTYLDGVLELLTPSRGHERQTWWIGMLLGVYAEERDIDLSAYGGWTLKSKLRRAGCEPDGCWVIGAEPATRKCPDLVIESQWSRSAIDKLEVYRRLEIREVWLARDDRITMYVLVDDAYQQVVRSACFPALDIAELCSFLDRPTMTAAMRAYRAVLRN